MNIDEPLQEGEVLGVRDLGPYHLEEVLGRGGMGVVYSAVHRNTGEHVALKTVLVTHGSLLNSIRWEVRTLGRIHHPGVVRILDSGLSGERPWYAMELVEGRTLRQLIERYWSVSSQGTASSATLPALPLLKLVRSLCAPLAYLHGSGLVHRDLKPGNVFIRRNGTVVLGDFGLVGAYGGASGREELQVDEGVQGTPLYMAPEQILGDLVDARADLYSLGCILYECVTGFPPFFGGTPGSIRRRHLQQPPTPPSQLLDEPLPERLEWLISKLLEKQPQDRLGYAEDVDRVLGELGVESALPAKPPRPRPYLYRPPFSGRVEAVQRIGARLDALAEGRGGCIFIGGGSGTGKTRLVMEMARRALRKGLMVVTGECIPLGLSGTAVDDRTRASPLHPFRPLLVRVADRCREEGWEAGQLLGTWGRVLVPYEPSLRGLPALDALPVPPPLASAAAERARIFTALQEALFALSEDDLMLLVLDDLQWADELTLGFLRQLRYEDLVSRGVLLLGTYRVEALGQPLLRDAVSGAPEALHLELGRLEATDIQAMIRGMLALRALSPVLDGLVRRSEGNPFFVAEYLRAAISQGLLHRDPSGEWHLSRRARASLESLALPASIAEIIRGRLASLDARTQVVAELAAVLGREFDAELLLDAVPLSEAHGLEALETLRVRQILERMDGGRLRFIHDKLREFSYGALGPERRRVLHHRAAEALERSYSTALDFALMFPGLANHWAKAEVHEQASRYYGLAGDRARAAHANDEAIRFYQSALAEAGMGREPDAARLPVLQESLGDVLALTGRQEEARAAYGEARSRLASALRQERARLHRKVGKTWETHHLHEDALRAYDEAEAALGVPQSGTGGVAEEGTAPRWWHEWVQVHVERIWVYYWMGRVAEMEAIIDKVRPDVEARGTFQQRARFFQALLLMAFKRDRYRVSDETVRDAWRAMEAGERSGDLAEMATCRFFLAFTLLFHDDLDASEQQGLAGLRLAELLGDLTLQSRLLTYLMQVYRRRGQVAEAREWSERCLKVSTAAGMDDYVGAVQATRAWVAWKEHRLDEAEREARAATDCWRKLSARYPFAGQWQGLVVLLALEARRGKVAEAVEHARELLDPAQQRLPDPLSGALEAAVGAWNKGQRREALEHLLRAVDLADEHHFL
ncbi:serine/threonine-protein kinase PknK [Pyxidicoccus trucidator]|uniref:serine/threonine-protein kinase n=1 Tax=Pyxidicoccus trucidator TaxID=2709662 RepID=UPI0013D9C12A|nr:serine/threonine-protein kinase [Pyxidicoccus trucidator]